MESRTLPSLWRCALSVNEETEAEDVAACIMDAPHDQIACIVSLPPEWAA